MADARPAPAARRRVRAPHSGLVRSAKPSRRASSAASRCNPRFRFCCYAASSPLLPWSPPSWPKARLRAPRHRAPVAGARGSSSRAGRGLVSGSAHRSARPPQPGSGQWPEARLRAAQRVLHHGEQLHPPLARGANEGREAWPWATSNPKVRFKSSAHGRYPLLCTLFSGSSLAASGGEGGVPRGEAAR